MIVVADIGCSHNGNISTALRMIEVAADCGAQYVKFQKRAPERMLTRAFLDAPYDSPFGDTYRAHRAALEFGRWDYLKLKQYAAQCKIGIFCSVWDEESADFCAEMGFYIMKIASADLTNDRLLRHCLKREGLLVVSTGMSRLDEIRHAVAIMAEAPNPCMLMHSTSGYPLADHDIRLEEIDTLRGITEQTNNVAVGYSCHAPDGLACILAAAKGVRFFEKHFTLSRNQPGGDHAASLEPDELRRLVADLQRVETIMQPGTGLLPCEMANKRKLSKCLRAARALPLGTVLAATDLCLKSPCEPDGFTGQQEASIVGRTARRTMAPEEHVTEDDLEPQNP